MGCAGLNLLGGFAAAAPEPAEARTGRNTFVVQRIMKASIAETLAGTPVVWTRA